MRAGSAIIALAALLCGCGEALSERPLELDIRGLSARATALVVKLRVGPLACRELAGPDAVALSADETQRWDRDSGAERAFTLAPVSADTVTVVAYALDDRGAPFQLACRTVSYDELGNLAGGRVVITLSRRVAAAPIVPR